MKKNIISSLFVILGISFSAAVVSAQSVTAPKAVAPPSVLKLPTANEVVEKYVKAIGGRETVMKFKTLKRTGTVELSPMGVKGTVEAYQSAPNKNLTTVNLDGIGALVEGYDGKSAWTVNPIQGNRAKTGQELLQVQLGSDFYRDLNIEKIYARKVVKGLDKVGDRSVYVLVLSSDGLPDDILYFDTETGLMLRSDSTVISPEGQQTIKTYYDDYRDADGIKSAFKIRAVTPSFEIVTQFSEVKYGVSVDGVDFSMPK